MNLFNMATVKARLLLGFGVMMILAALVGGVGWWGISNIQQAFNALHRQSLPEIAQSISLMNYSASLIAEASFIANAEILFHLDAESVRLNEKLRIFSSLAQQVHTIESVNLSNVNRLDELTADIEAALLDLVEVTRQSIFLTAEMRDRYYELISAYETLEHRISRKIQASTGQNNIAWPAVQNTITAEHNLSISRIDRSPQLLASILGEAHRTTGAMIAAMTAEDTESLRTLEARYQIGDKLLQRYLQQLADNETLSGIEKPINVLLQLGTDKKNIFDLRRKQFANEDKRSYLLTTSSILSAKLNDLVSEIVEHVKQTTENSSVKAVTELSDSKTRILFLTAICLAAAFLSALYVIRDLGGNLHAVTRSMIRLAEGNREIKMPAIARHDEIGDLARAFEVFRGTTLKLDDTSQQLSEKNRLLAAIFDSMNDGLSAFDADGVMIAWNRKLAELYGIPQTYIKANSSIEDIKRFLTDSDMSIYSLDGQPVSPEEMFHGYQQVEIHLPEDRILELRSSAMPNGGLVTIHTDLTERKTTEAQLRQAQKMESVGQLTGGLAHDFNNLLAAIIGNLSLLQEGLEDQESLREKALRALEAADRGSMITQRLLAFARKQALQPQQVDINELVEAMMDLLSYSVGEMIDISWQPAAAVWPIVIDPGQLENALMNLALNSRDAMPKGGRLIIQTENRTLNEIAAKQMGIDAGDHVVLSVTDSGVGMPPEVLNRVFEPFYTTKKVGAGSGLGLSMVYGFIKQSGGQIHIDSMIDRGTTIQLYLPRAKTLAIAPQVQQPRREVTELDPRNKTIMVIEDDDNVRQTTVDMLTSLGYQTLQAVNGQTALALLDKVDNISLLLCDVMLPGDMNGPEIVKEARKRKPNIGVLYCSGYTRDKLVVGGYLREDVNLIQKPYQKESLAEKLHAVFRH